MEGLILTRKEQTRLQVLNGVLEHQVRVDEAAQVLAVSQRHLWRILAAYRKEGAAALAHGNRGRRSANAIPEGVRDRVVGLAQGRYVGANHTHLTELLAEKEGIVLGRSTVRRMLVRAGVASSRQRRPPRHRVRRQRMPQEGMLVQIDGSPHDWLEGRGPRLSLLLAVDDATSTIPYALFRQEEDTCGYFLLLEGVIQRRGVPIALYSDRHGVFRTPTRGRRTAEEQEPTQFGRAMEELGVQQIFARSPEAKGRVERANGTLQDRLVTELRLAGSTTIEQANQVLWDYLPRFNQRFGVAPPEPTNAYRPINEDLDLGSVFSFKYTRRVARDNTVKYNWRTLQLLPTPDRPSYAGTRVEVQERLDGSLVVCYQGRVIPTQEAPPRLTALRALGRESVRPVLPGSGHLVPQQRSQGLKPRRGASSGAGLDELLLFRSTEPGRALSQNGSPHLGNLSPSLSSQGRLPTPRQLARWQAIQKAKRQGHSLRAIAEGLDISRNTVRKYVAAASPPTNPSRPRQPRDEEDVQD